MADALSSDERTEVERLRDTVEQLRQEIGRLKAESRHSHETCVSLAGPYCPETREPCDRMCQSLCNRRTGEATEHRPENIDCAICKAELPLSMIEMGGRLCPNCAGMPAQKASEVCCPEFRRRTCVGECVNYPGQPTNQERRLVQKADEL